MLVGFVAMAMPAAVQAAPNNQTATIFMGDNPSGKVRPDGSPSSRELYQKPTPQSFAVPLQGGAECPSILNCVFIPAAYHNNNPADPVDWGNYDQANRPFAVPGVELSNPVKIRSIVIHDIEGTCQAAIDAFKDPLFFVSAHYLVCADGTVIQMVRNKDIAWHAGNWGENTQSIGIEHEGRAASGGTDYTLAMYQASAKLVKWLAAKYNIPLDRQHIIGHDQVPAQSGARIPTMNVDPGPFWNWEGYMSLLGVAKPRPRPVVETPLVLVAPRWPNSQQPVTGCWPPSLPTCVPEGLQPTNFVYLRTQPSYTAPFITDSVLGQGSTHIANQAARASYGLKLARIGHQSGDRGVWYQVWFAGQKAWFHSPFDAPTAFPANGKYVTLKPGKQSAALYGQALPELTEYPADFVPPPGSIPAPQPLPYSLLAGQRYSVTDLTPPTGRYFNWTFDHRLPYDQVFFLGQEDYLQVQYNGRPYFVKKADVVLAN